MSTEVVSSLFHESFGDALRECIAHCGGFKVVGATLWPEKGADIAGRHLADCLNDAKREKLSPEQVLLILRLARERGCHAGITFIARELGLLGPAAHRARGRAGEVATHVHRLGARAVEDGRAHREVERANREGRRMNDEMARAEARADEGMARAAQHAEAVAPGWCARAVESLRGFAKRQTGPFLIESARFVMQAEGLPVPPEERAWGAVTRQASKAGFIAMTDRMGRAVTSNGSPKPLWVKGPNA